MSLMMDDIKYFVTVCETLNVTRASEIIGISQPALSYSIKRLENELGGNLLIRLKNGIQLTKLGEEFKQRSRRLLYEWEQAQNLANPESGLVQGSYTIAVHPSVALYTLGAFMPSLQSDFAGLDFNFIHGLSREMTEKVISWEADFGIVVNPIKHPDLVIHKLCTDEVTIFHTKNAQDKLIYDQNLAQSQYILKKISKRTSFSGVLSSGNLEVVAKLTSLGFGYGLLPTRVAAQYKQLEKLKEAPVFKDEICLVYRPEKHNNTVSKKIIQTIKSSSF
ncbi:HTH-type transcriptional regulator CynR [Bdellovibrio bacteriovorus]|uniref:LysR family transcriptional regulator n=1 Tax=Bdellovibrio bacteriovorus TaxID=959 RepID=UPI00045C083A|nr:LysR family transcriptional regulator [Bdellovibrio bacteriovorus]AHZ84014.1 LysR family transcriptional regulator [Bdellovibrio bacteriovorus]BEV67897.1 HTH-type transcriptional regulator CynR [Bdellovibrio bacteriovorus]